MPWPPLVSGYVEKPQNVKVLSSNEIQEILQKSQGSDCQNVESISANQNNINTHTSSKEDNLSERKKENITDYIRACQQLDNHNQLVFEVKQTGNNMDEEECVPKCKPPPWPDRIEMSPPFYGDIGKQARDIFSKGFNFSMMKLDFKTKTKTGVEFNAGGVRENEGGTITGNLESKYKFKDQGVTFVERWNTDNLISTEITLADFCEGVKVGLDSSFSPASGDKSCKLKADYKNDFSALNLGVDFKRAGPKISGSAVIGYKGWIFGYKTEYESESGHLGLHSAAMGFIGKDFIVASAFDIDEGRIFSGSIYQKVNDVLETGIQIAWKADEGETDFGVGCKYALCEGSTVGFKVNNQAVVGLGLKQKMNDAVSMVLSCELDSESGEPKGGFGIEVEA